MVFIEGIRGGYTLDKCSETMTVQELIDYLAEFDPDEQVYFRNNDTCVYCSITHSSFSRREEDEQQ